MRFEQFNMDDERNIIMPARATDGSAGYDFYAPEGIFLLPGADYVVHTGIKVQLDKGWAGLMIPRSGLGFKYGMSLANTVGLIDSDFRDEIRVKIHNPSVEKMEIEAGDRFAQFVFFQYGLVENDKPVSTERTGGFGSTGK